MQAAAAGVTIVDGAGVADTITAGAIIVATNDRLMSPDAAFIDPLPR
jgi:hypothetical protein